MKANSIKMYDKFNCLRIEMNVYDPKEFQVHHRDEAASKRWVPMEKTIANLYRYAEISLTKNKRLLVCLKNIKKEAGTHLLPTPFYTLKFKP